MRYYLIAGEASGDMHGSNLMVGLKSADPEWDFRFWGGDMMAGEGGTLVKHYRDGAVMGFVEVVKKLDKIRENFKLCRQDILDYRPDVLILIDYPGFNLKMAKFARRHGIPVFYYISPKVWAWKESRVRLLKKYVDMLYIIFPFEVEYFKKKQITARYFGNPLIDRIERFESSCGTREEFLHRHSLPDKPSIAFLPGSRRMEIDFLMPRLKGAAEIIEKKYPGRYQFLIAAAPSTEESRFGDTAGMTLIRDDTYSILRFSEAAVISSGTASLEAALIGIPQLVCYGGSPLSIWIARRVIKLNTISLACLTAGHNIFNEWIQEECSPEAIAEEIERLSTDSAAIAAMKAEYKKVREAMSAPGASKRVGRDMVETLRKIS